MGLNENFFVIERGKTFYKMDFVIEKFFTTAIFGSSLFRKNLDKFLFWNFPFDLRKENQRKNQREGEGNQRKNRNFQNRKIGESKLEKSSNFRFYSNRIDFANYLFHSRRHLSLLAEASPVHACLALRSSMNWPSGILSRQTFGFMCMSPARRISSWGAGEEIKFGLDL